MAHPAPPPMPPPGAPRFDRASARSPAAGRSARLLAGLVLALMVQFSTTAGNVAIARPAPVRPAMLDAVRLAQPATPGTTSPAPAGPTEPLGDPYRSQQWHLDRLGLTPDRPVPDGSGQVIAILDSGVDLAHPDLVEVLARTPDDAVLGHDFVDDDAVPQDEFGHGTMVAGVAAARSGNGLGVAGTVSGGVAVLPVRVLDEHGQGSSAVVAEGIDWAVANGATVINLSIESAGVRGVQSDPELARAVEEATAAGVVVVVAAGNTDEATPHPHPVGSGRLVFVGATDRADHRAGFSGRGPRDLLMAPGVEIVSTWCRRPASEDTVPCDGRTHTYGIADGTSFAAPQVSGLVAMLASTGLTPVEALDRLAATARDLDEPGADPVTGRGLVSADASLGPWPDGPVPATAPSPLSSVADPERTPGTASPRDVAPVDPPAGSGIPTRVLVAVAVLVAVGLVVRGLTGGPGRGSDGPGGIP